MPFFFDERGRQAELHGLTVFQRQVAQSLGGVENFSSTDGNARRPQFVDEVAKGSEQAPGEQPLSLPITVRPTASGPHI